MATVRATARTGNEMAKKKNIEDDDDIIIAEIEDDLDLETEKSLARAADTVCRECMQIQRKENVLIVGVKLVL